ncbi:MAG: hypothetical protein RL206_1124 [Bacteroidota bacterium]
MTSKSIGLLTECAYITAAVIFGPVHATRWTVESAERHVLRAESFVRAMCEFGAFLLMPTAFGLNASTAMWLQVQSREFRTLVGLGLAPRRNLAQLWHVRGLRRHPMVGTNPELTRRTTPNKCTARALVTPLRHPSSRLGMAASVPVHGDMVVARQGVGLIGTVPRHLSRFPMGPWGSLVPPRLDRSRALEGSERSSHLPEAVRTGLPTGIHQGGRPVGPCAAQLRNSPRRPGMAAEY